MSTNALELSATRAIQPANYPAETDADNPRSDIRAGAIVAVIFFVVLWPMVQATYALERRLRRDE